MERRTARMMVFTALVVGGMAPALIGAAPTGAAPQPPPDVSVAYQVNSFHDGHQASGVEVPPLTKRWTRDLGGLASYPLIVDGRVFVTAPTNRGGYGTTLFAFDAATGNDLWGPIDLGGTYLWSAIAYGQGRVFAINFDGVLQAFDARTGKPQWIVQLPNQYAFTSAPTYRNGLVYVGGAGSGGTVYAVSALNGHVLWTQSVENGDESSPAVSDTGVYVSYACIQAYDFDPRTGAPIWHHSGPCEGGGGRTPVLSNGRVWTRDDASGSSLALSSGTGALIGSFDAGPAPAFDGQVGFFLSGSVLKAKNALTQSPLWSFQGDGQLSSAPMVVNGYVYIGSTTGHLWALDETTGTPVWDDSVGAPILAPDEHNVSQPLTGLGAGQGVVVVPASNLLVAYAGASGPTARSVPVPRGWGLNLAGELGDGTAVERDTPVPAGPTGATGVSGGLLHTLSRQADGTVRVWGWNGYGQLGDTTTSDHHTPFTLSGLTHVVQVSAGALQSLALRDDGTVWAWGWNGLGQLGDGTTTDRHAPVQVAGLTGVVAIAAGFHHNLALRDDGTVWAWGWNGFGQLGDGTFVDRHAPVQVAGLSHVTSIAGGALHSLALRDDGTVWAWGSNTVNQLGDGTTTDHKTPVPVPGLDHVDQISAGVFHNLALRDDGSVRSWGWNAYGQLGDGTTTNRATPVPVAAPAGVVQVAAGGLYSLMLDETGSVRAWGSNAYGQLGDGTTTDRSVPTPVPGAPQSLAISAGVYDTLTS